MTSRINRIEQDKGKVSISSKNQHKRLQRQSKRSTSKHRLHPDDLFGSKKLQGKLSKKQSSHKQSEGITNSHKVITTDESNNCYESNIHESVFYYDNKEPNDQYFQSIPHKDKKVRGFVSQSSSRKNSKIKDLSIKLKQMQKLVVSQDQQVKKMKGTLNQKELHRLIKIHSIERLKVVSTATEGKTSAKRRTKA